MLEFTFVHGELGYELSKDLRNSVFSAKLSDEMENNSYHLVGYDKTKQIAVARLTMLTETVCHIDFMAVKEDYRRQFVGDLAIKALEDKAKTLGAKEAIADAPYASPVKSTACRFSFCALPAIHAVQSSSTGWFWSNRV